MGSHVPGQGGLGISGIRDIHPSLPWTQGYARTELLSGLASPSNFRNYSISSNTEQLDPVPLILILKLVCYLIQLHFTLICGNYLHTSEDRTRLTFFYYSPPLTLFFLFYNDYFSLKSITLEKVSVYLTIVRKKAKSPIMNQNKNYQNLWESKAISRFKKAA